MSAPDLTRIRAQFPILSETINGRRLAYLDNAATTQKPASVIESIDHYYRHENSNVHRAVHELAARATARYEGARDRIAAHFKVPREEIVFTRGTTEAINLVARSYLQPRLTAGDEVLVTEMEHHSNIVPWQLAGARTVAAQVNARGELDIDDWRAKLNSRTRLVAVTHVSNSLGTINPVEQLIELAHEQDIPVLIDGAQALAHMELDLASLGADFYAVSAHKAYGPTGFGVLHAKRTLLESMPPWHGGGDMISTVAFDGSTWNEVPYKFEAGTPDMAGAAGMASALDWLESAQIGQLAKNEQDLLSYGTERLSAIPGLRLIGTAEHKAGVLSFVIDKAHAHDLGSLLDQAGIAVRTGHHCTMPLMEKFGIPATVRASLAAYNGVDDIDQLCDGIRTAQRLLA